MYITLIYCLFFALVSDIGCTSSNLPPVVSESCPSVAAREEIHQDIYQQVISLLSSQPATCLCGGPGEWTRIAHLNMSDPSQQCPPNWNLTTTPVIRGCGRSSYGSSCDSATFPSAGRSYSHVCGQVQAYQKGTPNAFGPSIRDTTTGLEEVYIDGVSLTHGAAGELQQHIWSFAAALDEFYYDNFTSLSCSCTNTNETWPHEVPSFVGDDYFCATGKHDFESFSGTLVYADDPLWDGEGCGPTNACCEFNNPPWFCTTLPQPTNDDIELRICLNQDPDNEDILISLVDIYVM